MRILIAEDDPETRRMLCIALEKEEVIEAEDGAEAVAMAECFLPDVILMDVMMPDLDGFAALQELKANPLTAGIPVVLTSAGIVRSADIEKGLALGARDYLKKPFHIWDLRAKLRLYAAEAKKSPGTEPKR